MWDNIISAITDVNSVINGIVWGWPMIILILGTGILLTFRTKAMQVRKLGESMSTTIIPTLKNIGKKKTKDKLKLLFKAEIAQSICKFSGFIV